MFQIERFRSVPTLGRWRHVDSMYVLQNVVNAGGNQMAFLKRTADRDEGPFKRCMVRSFRRFELSAARCIIQGG